MTTDALLARARPDRAVTARERTGVNPVMPQHAQWENR
jgi:hypothetical protein